MTPGSSSSSSPSPASRLPDLHLDKHQTSLSTVRGSNESSPYTSHPASPTRPDQSRPTSLHDFSADLRSHNFASRGGSSKYGSVGNLKKGRQGSTFQAVRVPSGVSSNGFLSPGTSRSPNIRTSSAALLTGNQEESWRYVSASSSSHSTFGSYSSQNSRLHNPAPVSFADASHHIASPAVPRTRSVSTNPHPLPLTTKRFSLIPSKPTPEELEEKDRKRLGAWSVLVDLQDGKRLSSGSAHAAGDGISPREQDGEGQEGEGESAFSLATSVGTVIRQRVGRSMTPSSVRSGEGSAAWDLESGAGASESEGRSGCRILTLANPPILSSSPPSMYDTQPLSAFASSSPRNSSHSVDSTFPHSSATDRYSKQDSLLEEDEEEEDELDRSVPSTPRASAHRPLLDFADSSPPQRSPLPHISFSPHPSPAPDRFTNPPAASAPAATPVVPKQSSWLDTLEHRSKLGLTRQQLDILKCAIAYTLASMFTFNSTLNQMLPSPSSAHMVATIAVYYNPAKSVGAMLEADVFCIYLSFFSSIVSLLAVATIKIADAAHSEAASFSAVFFWMGGACAVLAWLKNWVGNATFNSGCSMAFIILSIVIVKEGGLRKLLSTILIVILGTSISNIVCFSLWPHSATSKLQTDINSTLSSFSTLLSLLSQTFLLDDAASPTTASPAPTPKVLAEAVNAHEKSFVTLKKNLAEAKKEVLNPKIQRAGERYDMVVESLTRLAQHLTGMRSGLSLQFSLLLRIREGKIMVSDLDGKDGSTRQEMFSPKREINGSDYFGGGKSGDVGQGGGAEDGEQEDEDAKLADDANLFAEVRAKVGPELRKLTTVCNSTLLSLRATFHSSDSASTVCDFDALREEVSSALDDFHAASTGSIIHLYGGESDEKGQAELAKGPKESVFLVFYFIFTFDEFTRELLVLLDSMSEILTAERLADNRRSFLGWRRVWDWISGRQRRMQRSTRKAVPNERRTLRKRMSKIIPIDPSEFKPHFPKKRPNQPGTATNPSSLSLDLRGRLLHLLWEFGSRIRQPDIKFAFKVGMATALLATPAFTETWKDTFYEYRGEWALISFFATVAPTVGQSNFLASHRLLGTIFGAVSAAMTYSLFPENPIALPVFGFFFSLPCFWYIVTRPALAASGRFVLLTYNLTALFSYNDRAKDTPVWTIAYHRALAVSIGVVATVLVSRYWWPFAARKELRHGLSDYLIDLSYLYTRLVATFAQVSQDSAAAQQQQRRSTDVPPRPAAGATNERTKLLDVVDGLASCSMEERSPLNSSVKEFMAMELHLQLSLIELRKLLDAAGKEPRFKGPFPHKLYNAILLSSQTMLDRFHSMRCVVNRDEWDDVVQRDYIRPANAERRELVGSVLLYFSTLAAAFRLKTPLPPYMPPAEKARTRLLDKVESLAVVRRGRDGGARHLLFFSYVLAMAGIIKELEYLSGLLQDAFGVIGGLDDFDSLFPTPEDDDNA